MLLLANTLTHPMFQGWRGMSQHPKHEGCNLIARELDRAFAMARFGQHEVLFFQVVREKLWGDPLSSPPPCRVNITSLADATGFNRKLLSRALNSLIASRVLCRDNSDSLLINESYAQWVFPVARKGAVVTPERVRFDDQQILYIRGSAERKHRKPKQKKVPGRLRVAVFERDAYRCRECGDHRQLCADHIIPESKGGPTTLENLQTLCRGCNSRKKDRIPNDTEAAAS
jgi:hypothetical protein